MTQQEFLSRRQALLAQMQPGSAALIFAAPEAVRSADSEYPYRQNSDFWYFTGFNEPEALLVLIKSDDTHNHSVLFNRVRDLTAEIWFGRRLGRRPRRRSWASTARWRSAKSTSSCSSCLTASTLSICPGRICLRR
jgi:Xaa-Pro aminopeptidase